MSPVDFVVFLPPGDFFMEDLWKITKLDYRTASVSDRAQYDRLVRSFREEEERYNRDHLLFGNDQLTRPDSKKQ